MERYYEFAGLRLKITFHEAHFPEGEGVLSAFRTEPGAWDYGVSFAVADVLPEPEGECIHREAARCVYRTADTQIRYEGAVEQTLEGAYMRMERRDNESKVTVKASAIPYGITVKLLLSALEAEHIVVSSRGVLLHAAWIELRGKAIAFTAPSGTGKSTQAALWERCRGAVLKNGDRAAIYPTDEGVEVRGIPLCGSSKVTCNATAPLAAVVYLSQAPVTAVTRLRGSAAFRALWEGCCVNIWNEEDMRLCAEVLTDIVSRVPVYHLACTPDESAIIALEKEVVL